MSYKNNLSIVNNTKHIFIHVRVHISLHKFIACQVSKLRQQKVYAFFCCNFLQKICNIHMVWFHISAISQITKFNLGPMDFTKNYKPDFFDKVQKAHLPTWKKNIQSSTQNACVRVGNVIIYPSVLKYDKTSPRGPWKIIRPSFKTMILHPNVQNFGLWNHVFLLMHNHWATNHFC